MQRPINTFLRSAVAVLARAYIGLLLSLTMWAVLPFAIGWTPTVVQSGSMEPQIMTGDVIAAEHVNADQLAKGAVKPGQVILAENPARPGVLLTHRVQKVLPDGSYITKGDANAVPDSTPIKPEKVSGIERLRVPMIGLPLNALRSGNLGPVALFALLTMAAHLIVRNDKARTKRANQGIKPAVERQRNPRRRLPSSMTRREARLQRRRNRGNLAKVSLAVAGLAVAAPTMFPQSSADFYGSTMNSGNSFQAAATFPVGPISNKALRFGVAEPSGDLNELDRVSREVNEYPSYSQIYQDFTSTFDLTTINATIARGVTPIVTWEPWIAANGVNQPAFKLSTLTSGAHDAYLNSVADQLKAAGNPHIYIRFAHEMNGTWYPWAESVNGNQPGDYVAAWKHVVDLFATKGVQNIDWVWAPNTAYGGASEIQGLYPGSSYVTHAGIDGFNWGSNQPPGTWAHPWDVLSTGLQALQTVAPDKNILVSETASTETEGANTKAQWIADLVYYLNHWGDGKTQHIEGFLWFDINKEASWRIDSSTASSNAMRDALAAR